MRASPRLIAVLAVLAAGPEAASAATPPGLPDVRVARAADQAARPGAHREWWTLRLVDPRSHAMLALEFVRSPDGSGMGVERRGPTGVTGEQPVAGGIAGPVTASGRALQATGPQGRAVVSLGRRRATVAVAAEGMSGRLVLGGLRPGPAALDVDLGQGQYNRQVIPQASMSWSMPIARSTVSGTLTIAGQPVRLDGWRASYEHGWGQLILEDTAHDYWDTWTVHTPRTTWVAFGINRTDTITGPGARDAMWLGVLARAGRGGTAVCRPRIQRDHWYTDSELDVVFAAGLHARCGRLRARFTDDRRLRQVDEYSGRFDADGPALIGGRGDGWVVHRGTFS